MALKIIKSDIDRNSGHITLQVCVVETHADGSTSSGPMETVGIAHQSLTRKYGCHSEATEEEIHVAIRTWLHQHHAVALSRKRALDQRGGVVAKLAGVVLEFGDEQQNG